MFLILIIVAIVGVIGAMLNMFFGFAGKQNNITVFFLLHILFGIMYVCGGVAALIFGIIWIVEKLA